MARVLTPFLRSPDDVAKEVIEVLNDQLPPCSEPYYLYRRREAKVSPIARNIDMQQGLLAACAELKAKFAARSPDQ
jgi:hypothetical protein